MLYYFLFLLLESFAITILLGWLVLRIFPRIGLMDRPTKYGLSRSPIPYPGGIVFYIVFLLNILIFFPLTTKYIGLLIALSLLVFVSFIDDRTGLSPFLRLCVQMIAATILALSGIGIETISNPFGGAPFVLNQLPVSFTLFDIPIHFSLLSYFFTVVWIVLFVNTLNWLDGIPGLVSGISGIGFFVIFLLSLLLSLRSGVGMEEIINAETVAALAVIGIGSCLAFVLFDFPPPKMIIGDTGSMFLGFMLAVLAIHSGSKIATTFLVLGFPVFDALFVITRRIFQKKSPFSRDLGHFHHRLLRIGISERKTNSIIYIICGLFGLSALLLGTQGKFFVIVAMLVSAITIEVVVILKEKTSQ